MRTLGPRELRVVRVSDTLTPPAESLCHVRRRVCRSHGLRVKVFVVHYSAHHREYPLHSTSLIPIPIPLGARTPSVAFEAAGAASPWDWTISDFLPSLTR